MQEPRRATPKLLKGLRTLLESSEYDLRLAGARALYHLECEDGLWVLLESPAERDWVYARLQASETLPEGLLEAFAQGRAINTATLALLHTKLPPEECAAVLARALGSASAAEAPLVRTSLAALGLPGLDVLPELLGHPEAEARRQGLLLLEQLLYTNLDTYVEWLAERGLVLPLHHTDPLTRIRLHEILAGFIEYSKAWRSTRFLPLLEELSRSRSRRAAKLALTSLAHLQPDPRALATLLEAARPAHQVRLAAWGHLRWSAAGPELAREVAAWPPDPHPRVQLQRLALQYLVLGLEEEPLRWALRHLEGAADDTLFLPTSPAQVAQLTDLVHDPDLGETAVRLLPRQVSRAAWVALVRALPSCPHADALVRKWPRLVVSLLKTPDGTARVAQLGSAAHDGLRLALARKGSLRLRALEVAPPDIG